MRLVIAEKPSVAQSIAAVLGAKSRHDGYLEGGGYIVSWCFGHLTELADAAVYNADDAKWTLAALPIIPTSFRFIVRSEKQKQFDILRELMRREDVAEVVNACDAGQCGWVTQEKGKRDLISLKIKSKNHLRSNSNETKSEFRP